MVTSQPHQASSHHHPHNVSRKHCLLIILTYHISQIYPQVLILVSQQIWIVTSQTPLSHDNHANICRNGFLRWFFIRMIHILIIIVIALHCISHYHRSPPNQPFLQDHSHRSAPPRAPIGPHPESCDLIGRELGPAGLAFLRGLAQGSPHQISPRQDTTRLLDSRFQDFQQHSDFRLRAVCQIWWVLQQFYILIWSDSPFEWDRPAH